MNSGSTQGQFTLVSDLEVICSEISSHISIFNDLKSRAERAKISVSDCFVRLIYSTWYHGGQETNLYTRLHDSAHTHNIPLIASVAYQASYFTAIESEIQNTYLSLALSNQEIYLDRLWRLTNECKNLRKIFQELEEHTREINLNIREKGPKITPELLHSYTEQKGLQTSGFTEKIPELLHIAVSSIWYFKPYELYFKLLHITLVLSALRVSQSTKEAPLKDRRKGRGIEGQTFDSFADLLTDATELPTLLKKLREANKKHPVIDDNNKFLKRQGHISIVIAWVDALQQRGKFKKSVDDKQMAKLLNLLLPGLELDCDDASIFRKVTNIRNAYHADFLALIQR